MPTSGRRAVFFEALETRALLATLDFSTLVPGILEFNAGTSIGNDLTISAVGTTGYRFDEQGETIDAVNRMPISCGATSTPANSVTVTCQDPADISLLTINLNDLADSVLLQSATDAVQINSGDSNDLVEIGELTNSLDGIQGVVNVDGGTNDLIPSFTVTVAAGGDFVTNSLPEGDRLIVNDIADTSDNTYSIENDTIGRGGTTSIIMTNVESLDLVAGVGTDFIEVIRTQDSTTTSIETTDGGDSVVIGATGDSSTTQVTGDSCDNDLQIDSTGDSSVTLLNAGDGDDTLLQVDNGVNSGTALFGEDEADSITIHANSTGSVTRAEGGDNSDTGNIGDASDSLDGIAGTVEFQGGDHDLGNTLQRSVTAGAVTIAQSLEVGDSLNLNDQGTTVSHQLILNGTDSGSTVQRSGTPNDIHFGSTETVALSAGAGSDTVQILSTEIQTRTVVNTTAGGDVVSIDDSGSNSIIEVFGDAGANDMEVTGSSTGSVVLLNGDAGSDQLSVEDNGPGSGVALNGDTGQDVIDIRTTGLSSAVRGEGGDNSDTGHIFNGANSLDGIQGAVEFVGGDHDLGNTQQASVSAGSVTVSNTLEVGDSLLIRDEVSIGNEYEVNSANLQRATLPQPIHYSLTETLLFTTGNAGDVVDVLGTADQARTAIGTGGGGDTVNVLGSGNSSILEIGGDNDATTMEVSATGNNSVTLLNGSGGNDSLRQFANGTNSGVSLSGDAGQDNIDVLGSAAGSATLATGGDDNDVSSAGDAASSLDPIAGTVEFVGGANGSELRDLTIVDNVPQVPYSLTSQISFTSTSVPVGDSLRISDAPKADGQSYEIGSVQAGRTGADARTLFYSEMETLRLTGGSDADQIHVSVPGSGASLPDVVTVDGGGGADNLVQVDSQSGAQDILIDGERDDAQGRFPFELSNANRLNVTGSSDADVIVSSLDASQLPGGGFINGDDGDDVLCSGSNLDLIVGGDGADFLCSTGGDTFLLPDHEVVGNVLQPISPPQNGDLVQVGPDDTAITLGADTITGINRSCGKIILTGAFQIDVICWLYAQFQASLPVAGTGDPATDPVARFFLLTRLPVGVGEGESTDWHNPLDQTDVDGDGQTTPLDALLIINTLNSEGSRRLVSPSAAEGEGSGSVRPYYDVTNDGFVSPADALVVINSLSIGIGAGEGEGEGGEGASTESVLAATETPNLALDEILIAAPFASGTSMAADDDRVQCQRFDPIDTAEFVEWLQHTLPAVPKVAIPSSNPANCFEIDEDLISLLASDLANSSDRSVGSD